MLQEKRSTRWAVRAADAALSSIDHAQRDDLSSMELVTLMHDVRRLADRTAALAAALTAEVDAKKSAEAATGTPLTSLLSTVEARDPRDAAREVFTAQDIAQHMPVQDAALEGRISVQQAQAVAKGMATLPELPAEVQQKVEQRYVERAEQTGATPRRLKELAGSVLAEVAPELLPRHETRQEQLTAQRERAVRNRYLFYSDDGDGSVKFRGLLPELEAQPFVALIDAYVERDRRSAKTRLHGLRAAGAGPEEIRRQRLLDLDRSLGQRRADALVALLENHRDGPLVAGDRPRVVVEMTLEELQQRAEEGRLGSRRELKSLPAGQLRRLLCDADLVPMVLGGQSEILDMGQATRLVTAAIRRALSHRDGGCIFPGCDKPDVSCEAHHVIPWWAGGATALHNLVLLCPHHHALVEPDRFARQDQWRVVFDPRTHAPKVIAPQRQRNLLQRRGKPPPETTQVRRE